MRQNPKCMNGPLNASQWIEIKWLFHNDLGITFHAQLEHSLFSIHLPMVEQRWKYRT
jgi:hypothetical protein